MRSAVNNLFESGDAHGGSLEEDEATSSRPYQNVILLRFPSLFIVGHLEYAIYNLEIIFFGI